MQVTVGGTARVEALPSSPRLPPRSASKRSFPSRPRFNSHCGAPLRGGGFGRPPRACTLSSYLVDPASNICLSQRLSHAGLSAHGRYSETANGSLNQLWFL